MDPIRVKWRIIAPGKAKAIEQRTVRVNYAVADDDDDAEETPESDDPSEFNIIASSPERARTVAAALLRLLRQDSRCSQVKPQADGHLEKE